MYRLRLLGLLVLWSACHGGSRVGATLGDAGSANEAGPDSNQDSDLPTIANPMDGGSGMELGVANGDASTELDGETRAPRDASSGSAPPPLSRFCGDGIRDPITEECDDGLGASADLCSEKCSSRSAVLFSSSDPKGAPSLGLGSHVVAGANDRFGLILQEAPEPLLSFQWFDLGGHAIGAPVDLSVGARPTQSANPVLASLPDGRAVIAWSNASDVSPDIVLAEVNPAALGVQLRTANEVTLGQQDQPDLLWTGKDLVVSWTDLGDVRYRTFAPNLAPTSGDETLAGTAAVETGAVLSKFDDGWAAAWRVGESATETISVSLGATRWNTVPPESPAPNNERPALVQLSETKILVLFSAPVPTAFGSSTFRLRAAVLDSAMPGPTATTDWFTLDRTTFDGSGAQRWPSALRVGDEVAVGWTETAVTGEDHVVAQTVRWNPSIANVEVTREMPLASCAPPSKEPRRASVGSVDGKAIVVAWECNQDIWGDLRLLPWVQP